MAFLARLGAETIGVRVPGGAVPRVRDTGAGVVIGGEDRTPPDIEGDDGQFATPVADPLGGLQVTETPDAVAADRGFSAADTSLLDGVGFESAAALPDTVNQVPDPAGASAMPALRPMEEGSEPDGLADVLNDYTSRETDPEFRQIAADVLRILNQTGYPTTPARRFVERVDQLGRAHVHLTDTGADRDPFLRRVHEAIQDGIREAPQRSAELRDRSTDHHEVAAWQNAAILAIDTQRRIGLLSDAEARQRMAASVVELFARNPVATSGFKAYEAAFDPNAGNYARTEAANRQIALGLVEHGDAENDAGQRALRAFLAALPDAPNRLGQAGATKAQAGLIREVFAQERALQMLLSADVLRGFSGFYHEGNDLDYRALGSAFEARSEAEQLELMDAFAAVLNHESTTRPLREMSPGMLEVRANATAILEEYADLDTNTAHQRAYARVATPGQRLEARVGRLLRGLRG